MVDARPDTRCQRASGSSARLEADLWPDHAEDRRGAAELLAVFADDDPVVLRHAQLGHGSFGFGGVDLLADAIECTRRTSAAVSRRRLGGPRRRSARRAAVRRRCSPGCRPPTC